MHCVPLLALSKTKAHEIHHVASWTLDMSTLISPSIRRFFYGLYDIQMKTETKYKKHAMNTSNMHLAVDTKLFSELFW